MKNPWEEIPLTDYENHMKLDSVMQLQAMNEMMKGQFDTYPISSVVIFCIAGGKGFEHIQKDRFEEVYGIDIIKQVNWLDICKTDILYKFKIVKQFFLLPEW